MLKKILKNILIFIVILIIGIAIIALLPAKTSLIKEDGKVVSNSIAEITKVKIGGIDQYLMIRGNNIDNPVIFFIHGGPGQSEIGYIREYQKQLEKKFTVVRWDQRGAGLSNLKDINNENLSLDKLVSDTHEITDYLIKIFNQPKILLAAHSWGTIIATNVVNQTPEKYLAYIGVGQYVAVDEGEKISYLYTLEEGKKQNNKEVISKLEEIGNPPYSKDDFFERAQCLSMLGGVFKSEPEISMGKSFLFSREYDLLTKLNYQKNGMNSSKILIEDMFKVNFLKNVKELKVPTYFIMGKYDYFTPTQLVKKFYEQLKAPKKKLIIFENSAHMPQLEEHDRFNNTIITIWEEVNNQ